MRQLRGTARSPLGLGRGGSGAVTFRPRAGWSLWRPCSECGGVELPLRDPSGADRGDPACPGCETRRRRGQVAGADPVVWYDTWLEDWVVRLPCGDTDHSAVMPMEIHWYDAGWAEVYRTAADIAFGGDPV